MVVSFPCGLCKNAVACYHRATQCDNCDIWWHIKCADVTPTEYDILKTNTEQAWTCPTCRAHQPGQSNLLSLLFSDDDDDDSATSDAETVISSHKEMAVTYDYTEDMMNGSDDSLIAPDQQICISTDEYIECTVESPDRKTEESHSQDQVHVENEISRSAKHEVLLLGQEELPAKQEGSSAENEMINVEDLSDNVEKVDRSFSASNIFIRDNENLVELQSQQTGNEKLDSSTPSNVNTPIRVGDFLRDADYGTPSKIHTSMTERWSSEKIDKLLNLARGSSNVVKCCVCKAVSSTRKRHLLHVSKHYLTMICVCGFSDKKRDLVTLHQKKTGHPRFVYEVSDDRLEDWQQKVMKPDITGVISHVESTTPVLSKKPTTKSAKSKKPTTKSAESKKPTTKSAKSKKPTTKSAESKKPTTKSAKSKKSTTKSDKSASSESQNEWIGKHVHRLIQRALGPKTSLRCGKCLHRSNTRTSHRNHVKQHYLSYKCECGFSSTWRKSVVSHQMSSNHNHQVYVVSHAMESKWTAWIKKDECYLTGATVDEWGPWVSDAVKEKIANNRGKPGCLICGHCGVKSFKTPDHFRHVDQHHVSYKCECGKSSKYKQSIRRHQNLMNHAFVVYVVSDDKDEEFEKVVVDNKQNILATNPKKLVKTPDTKIFKNSDTKISPVTKRWVSETIENQITIARGTNTLTCGICELISKSCMSHFFHVDTHFLTWRCECGFKSETSRKSIVTHLARTGHPPVIYAISEDKYVVWEDTVMSFSPYKSKKTSNCSLSEKKHENYLQQNEPAIDSSNHSVAVKFQSLARDSRHEQTGNDTANMDDQMLSLSKISNTENWVSETAVQAIRNAMGPTGVLKCGVCQLISSSEEKHQEHVRTHYITYRCECNYASAYIGCTRRHQRKLNHKRKIYILSEDRICSWEKEQSTGKETVPKSVEVNATNLCSVVLDPLHLSAIRKRKHSELSASTEDEMDNRPETSGVSTTLTNSQQEEHSTELKKRKRRRRMLMDLQKQLCEVQTTVSALMREEESDME